MNPVVALPGPLRPELRDSLLALYRGWVRTGRGELPQPSPRPAGTWNGTRAASRARAQCAPAGAAPGRFFRRKSKISGTNTAVTIARSSMMRTYASTAAWRWTVR